MSRRTESSVLPWPSPFVAVAWNGTNSPRLSSISRLSSVLPGTTVSTSWVSPAQVQTSPPRWVTLKKEVEAAPEAPADRLPEPSPLRLETRALSSLVRQYHDLRLVSGFFMQWHSKAVQKRPKRRKERLQRICLALRWWRKRCGATPVGQGAEKLAQLVAARRRHGFLQLQQPLLHERLQRARALLLQIIHRRTQLQMATLWWQQVHLRSAWQSWRADAGRPHPPAVGSESMEVSVETRGAPFVLEATPPSHREAPRPSSGASTPRGDRPRPSTARLPRSTARDLPDRPENFLLRVQQAAFRRWWHASCMKLSHEELVEERRRAALLVLIRQKALNAMAWQHWVASLQRKAFESLLHEDSQEDGRTRRHHRRRPSRTRPGLRGTSIGEVLQKAWQRWRYTVAAGLQVLGPPLRVHSPHVALALCHIASEIAAQRARALQAPSTASPILRVQRPRALEAPSFNLLEQLPEELFADEAIPVAEPSLVFLQQALASFSSRGLSIGDDLSPISLWPSEAPHRQESELGGRHAPGTPWARAEWSGVGSKLDVWQQMLREAPLPPAPTLCNAPPEAKQDQDYQGLRRRAFARRLLKTV